jgi:hypothetical protein
MDKGKPEKGYTMKQFLELVPPGKRIVLIERARQNRYGKMIISLPIIELYCASQKCDGLRSWHCDEDIFPHSDPRKIEQEFITFVCRNCGTAIKHYAIQLWKTVPGPYSAMKYGEDPAFGPPPPARLMGLIGEDREHFLAGRRAENQGMGIGAFSYYRRVIENQKNRIFQAIIDVARKLSNCNEELIMQLESAKDETQFSKAVEGIKAGLPPILLIDGHHNPLTLLHAALSDGIHDRTDDECLERATDIRMVMTDLAERISIALKDVAGLSESVSRLMKRKPKPKRESQTLQDELGSSKNPHTFPPPPEASADTRRPGPMSETDMPAPSTMKSPSLFPAALSPDSSYFYEPPALAK